MTTAIVTASGPSLPATLAAIRRALGCSGQRMTGRGTTRLLELPDGRTAEVTIVGRRAVAAVS